MCKTFWDFIGRIILRDCEDYKNINKIFAISAHAQSGKSTFLLKNFIPAYIAKFPQNSVGYFARDRAMANYWEKNSMLDKTSVYYKGIEDPLAGHIFDLIVIDSPYPSIWIKSRIKNARLYTIFLDMIYCHLSQYGIVIICDARHDKKDLIGKIVYYTGINKTQFKVFYYPYFPESIRDAPSSNI